MQDQYRVCTIERDGNAETIDDMMPVIRDCLKGMGYSEKTVTKYLGED